MATTVHDLTRDDILTALDLARETRLMRLSLGLPTEGVDDYLDGLLDLLAGA